MHLSATLKKKTAPRGPAEPSDEPQLFKCAMPKSAAARRCDARLLPPRASRTPPPNWHSVQDARLSGVWLPSAEPFRPIYAAFSSRVTMTVGEPCRQRQRRADPTANACGALVAANRFKEALPSHKFEALPASK